MPALKHEGSRASGLCGGGREEEGSHFYAIFPVRRTPQGHKRPLLIKEEEEESSCLPSYTTCLVLGNTKQIAFPAIAKVQGVHQLSDRCLQPHTSMPATIPTPFLPTHSTKTLNLTCPLTPAWMLLLSPVHDGVAPSTSRLSALRAARGWGPSSSSSSVHWKLEAPSSSSSGASRLNSSQRP